MIFTKQTPLPETYVICTHIAIALCTAHAISPNELYHPPHNSKDMKDPYLSGLFHHFSTSPVLVLLSSAFPTVASVAGSAIVGG